MSREPADFDIILAGGGLAGRSLAYFLSRQPGLDDARILLVDDSRHYQHRAIVYWYDGVLPLHLTPSASYTTLAVDTATGLRRLSLDRHTLSLTSSQRIFRSLDQVIDADPRITRLDAHAARIHARGDRVAVTLTDGRSFTASHCCDSTAPPSGVAPPLLMTGEIRQVRTVRDSFDPAVATFMDFRSGDGEHPARFHCLLPVSAREAFVETTRITRGDTPAMGGPFETAASEYLRSTCGVTDFSTLTVQRGAIPLGLHRQASRGRHLYVGTASGIIKATTGYGFTRILHQAERVASSFAATGSPRSPEPSRRFHFYDKPVLGMWLHDPEAAVRFMRAAFAALDVDLILDFLDERTTPLQERELLGAMPVRMLLRPRLWL
ncbi:lycopene cyclase family protein [Arthrobacter antioxidans]|uniref:lycopene cyclase family protein n=1 Tax=Arthrobacter antioxidans TaxID=2895818 RepID=UPI001FFF8C6F|nr:lycopene cyclase family protein [Arthrobacter antioxidans]